MNNREENSKTESDHNKIAREILKKDLLEEISRSQALKNQKVKEMTSKVLNSILQDQEIYIVQPSLHQIIMQSYECNVNGRIGFWDSQEKSKSKK